MSDVEGGGNFGDRAVFLDSPENNIGSSDQFIGNFLASPGDPSRVVQNRIWVTSDTHFGHKNILIYEAADRPWTDRDKMDAGLIQRWNDRVGSNDVVFHLGDFSFGSKGRVRDVVSKLNGRKFLLLGNHDREQRGWDWIDLGFERVFKNPFLMDGRFIFSHEPLAEVPDGKVNVYGHVHGSKHYNTKDDNRICMCVERWNCAPVPWDYVKSLFN